MPVPSSSEAPVPVQELRFLCEQPGWLLWGGVRGPCSSEQGKAGEAGLRSSRARVAGRTGCAGSLPPCAGKCDSELWELGLESSPGEAAESVTPLYGLVMATLRIWSVLKKGTTVTERVALRATANKERQDQGKY